MADIKKALPIVQRWKQGLATVSPADYPCFFPPDNGHQAGSFVLSDCDLIERSSPGSVANT